MAQIRTGVEGNRSAGCLQLKNDQLIDARRAVRDSTGQPAG
jgi:hypothetical protein